MKPKLNSIVKPQVFWPSIVILLATCLAFYIFQKKEKNLRVDIQHQLTKVIDEKKITEQKLTEAVNAKEVIEKKFKRMKAIEIALIEAQADKDVSREFIVEKIEEALGETTGLGEKVDSSKVQVVSPLSVTNANSKKLEIAFWVFGLGLVQALAFLFWRRNNSGAIYQLKKIKSELQDKEKHLEHERSIRKAIEVTSLRKEGEYQDFELKLIEKDSHLQKIEAVHRKTEEALLEKEKEFKKLKHSFNALKDILDRKGLVKELTSPEEKGKLWILGDSPERRLSPRVCLTKDFSRTIILRIEISNSLPDLKCLAKDISLAGLCFETKRELNENGPMYIRLFFYGDQVPMFRLQAYIVWKRINDNINHYGVCFDCLEETTKAELGRYIEMKMVE